MATIRGKSDEYINQIVKVLAEYEAAQSDANVDVYRQNPASVRIRIIDPSFESMERSARHARVWQYLDRLDDETAAEISMLVLVTPKELKTSLANLEFEDPIPSAL